MLVSLRKYYSSYRALINLGVPIVIGQLGNILLGFADTIMIGHHSTIELGAAGFINTLFALLLIFAMGFSYGLTPIVGNMFGRGENDGIGGQVKNLLAANTLLAAVLLTVALTFYFNLHKMGQPDELLPLMRPYLLVQIISLPFVCWFNVFKQFFDVIGDSRTPMIVIIVGVALNVIGNYMLIYGVDDFLGINGGSRLIPEMGLFGAGLSTLISRILMAAALIVIYFTVRRYRIYRDGFLRGSVNRRDFLHANAISWPLGFQMGMENAAFSLTAIMVGWIGTASLAAHQVMLTVSQLFYMVYCGMAAAVAVRVSYFHGQRDPESISRTSWAGFHLILVIAVVVAVPLWLLRHQFSYWFTDSADVCALVVSCVPALILYQFGDGMQCTFANALRGLSCVRSMMIVSFISYFVISLPLSYLFGIRMQFGLAGIWAAFPICLTVAGVLYYSVFLYYKKRLF